MNRILLAVIFLFPLLGYGQTIDWAYQKSFSTRTWGKEVGTDSSNNTYLFGSFSGLNQPDSTTPRGNFITKYAEDGTLIWEKTIITNGYYSNRRDFQVDEGGNIYMLLDLGQDITIDNENIYLANGDGIIVKLDSNFQLKWFNQFKQAELYSISIDDQNNVYLTGFLMGLSSFGNFNLDNSNDSSSGGGILIVKYDSLGTCLWAKSEGSWLSQAHLIQANNNEGIYIAGIINDTSTIGTATISEDNGRSFIAKFDTAGVFQWIDQLSPYLDVNQIAIDEFSNIYYTGFFLTTASFGSFTLNALHNNGDLFMVRYNKLGTCLWAKSVTGRGNKNFMTSTTNKEQKLIVAGYYNDTIVFENNIHTTNSLGDFFIAKIDSLGDINWSSAQQNTTTGGNIVYGVSTGSANEIFIAGAFTSDITLGSSYFTNGGYPDGFITKLTDPTYAATIDESKLRGKALVYPNPAKAMLHIQYSYLEKGSCSISLKNQLGQTVFTKKYPAQNNFNESLDISTYPKGVYFVELTAGEIREVKKLVVN
jgi:hypothetical protein